MSLLVVQKWIYVPVVKYLSECLVWKASDQCLTFSACWMHCQIGCLNRCPRLMDRIREAADEYVQYEVHQCNMAVDRWPSECMNAHRKRKATESALLAMEQRHHGELQMMLRQQEERLLQQQVQSLV